jgi:hypothetical protein
MKIRSEPIVTATLSSRVRNHVRIDIVQNEAGAPKRVLHAVRYR